MIELHNLLSCAHSSDPSDRILVLHDQIPWKICRSQKEAERAIADAEKAAAGLQAKHKAAEQELVYLETELSSKQVQLAFSLCRADKPIISYTLLDFLS